MSVSVRPAEEADRPALFALFSVAFSSPADPAEWAWKYDGNPNPSVSVVAEEGGRIVGFFGGFGTRYRGAEGDLPGVAGVDVMTDPSARTLGRRTLFQQLGLEFFRVNGVRGVPFGFGFPNERHRLAAEKTIGYRPVEPARQWTRALTAPSLIGRLRRRFLKVRAGEAFSAAHDALAEVLHARAGWRTDRSQKTMNWRFAARPNVSYAVHELVDARGRSRACAVLRIAGERGLLVDLQAADEDSGAVGDLLVAVGESLPRTTATQLVLRAGTASRLAARAAELGFVPAPTDTYFEVRPFTPAFDLERAAPAFDYRFVDHEIF
ncbi:MAG: GNAT family N-acetyltransferase [Acidobacteriota bacterium]